MTHQLTEIQRELLQVLSDFRTFCDQHQLQYYACGGTSIGAVRHQGFIPWDDDIDVYMTIDDYHRFLALKESLTGSKYEIISIDNENYYLPGFAKWTKVDSSIWEEACYPFMMGVYIDVFPLYEVDSRENFMSLKAEIEYYNDVYARSILRYRPTDIIRQLKERKLRGLASLLINIFYHRGRKQYYRDQLQARYQIASMQRGAYLVNYSLNPRSDMFEKQWFESIIELPFENQSMKMPIGYHHYLTTRFGDYMTPPPPQDRITHHKRHFEHFERRYTIEEATRLMSKS